jgi:hypothetical protein
LFIAAVVEICDQNVARRNLAAAYRLIALFGWDDHVATHLLARLPDGTFLLNPFGPMPAMLRRAERSCPGFDD